MHLERWARRTAAIVVTVASTVTFWSTAAFAQYPGGTVTPTPTPSPTATVLGGRHARGTATTGADVLRYVLIAAVILLIGLALLRLSRSATARED